MKRIVAIDPGKSGGICVWQNKLVDIMVMPQTVSDLWYYIDFTLDKKFTAIIEKVHAMPGQGVTSMFSFGRHLGNLEMALIAKGIQIVEVLPQTWMKYHNLGKSSTYPSKRAWKLHLVDVAQKLFPDVQKFNLKTNKDWLCVADSLLLLYYALYLSNNRM